MNPYEVDCKVKDLLAEEEFEACKLEMTELCSIQGVMFTISTKGKGKLFQFSIKILIIL